MRFEDLRLSKPLLDAINTAGYRIPTPIQCEAIPYVLAGRDVLGCAQTGTGKTAAFALPILQRISEGQTPDHEAVTVRPAHSHAGNGERAAHPAQGHKTTPRPANNRATRRIRCLVLCPTRELAQQIHDSFKSYGAHTGIRLVAVFGGVNQHSQVRALQAGVDVVIATPGRLMDLMEQGHVHLSAVEYLVLDEADRMLDMGFLPDIRRILAEVPRQRQSLLFSATMPASIRTLAQDILRNPALVEVARVSSPAETVDHWVYHVESPEKSALLVRLLNRAPSDRALVFTRTKRGADKLTKHLVGAGLRAVALHGNKSQGARTRALGEFRSAQTPVLVATDIAARGLDVDDVAQVINYDLTDDPETYVHRIGRTGRAGASGKAVSFCTSHERGDLRAIERLLREPLKHAIDRTSDGGQPKPVPRTDVPARKSSEKPEHPRRAEAGPRPSQRVGSRRSGRKFGSRTPSRNATARSR